MEGVTLDRAVKDQLGGAMNLLIDSATGAVRIIVVGFPDNDGNVQLRKDVKGTCD